MNKKIYLCFLLEFFAAAFAFSCSDYEGADITYRVTGTCQDVDIRLLEDDGKIKIENKSISLPWELKYREQASRGPLGCDDWEAFSLGFSVTKNIDDGSYVYLELIVDNLDTSEDIYLTESSNQFNTEISIKTVAEIYGPCLK